MGGRITLGMTVFWIIPWINLIKSSKKVFLYIRISIFVNRYSSRCMGTINYGKTILGILVSYKVLYLGGYIDHFIMLIGFKMYLMDHLCSPATYRFISPSTSLSFPSSSLLSVIPFPILV